MRKNMHILQYSIVLAIASLYAIASAIPIFITITNSFMTAFEIQSRYSAAILPSNVFYTLEAIPQIHFVRMGVIPTQVSLRQYWNLIQYAPFIGSIWNSVAITFPAVAGQLIISVPAAYAFEFCQWRHKEKLFLIYLIVMLMPLPVVLVPQFIVAQFFGISESSIAVILPAIFGPFGVFLIRQFLKTMPLEYLEAAKMDGAGHLRILHSIIIPLSKPAIAALALLVFIDYWNVVDQALVFIRNRNLMPLSVHMTQLAGNFDIVFAASFFYMLPALFVFLHGQEHFMEGLKMSGLK